MCSELQFTNMRERITNCTSLLQEICRINMDKFERVTDDNVEVHVSRKVDRKQVEEKGTSLTIGEKLLCICKKNMKRRNSKFFPGEIESPEKVLQVQPEFMKIDEDNIPIFVHKSIEFIEDEGLDSVGLYRVPGNSSEVDLMFQKFEEDRNVDLKSLNISVNAVATALKFFFSKMFRPLFNKEVLAELEEIKDSPNISSDLSTEVKKEGRFHLTALRNLLNKLPLDDFAILKFLFQHFVRVAEHSIKNNMKSKNLAICWWPTLIQTKFTDMGNFEQLRPHFEDIVQAMIDEFPYFFSDDILITHL